MIDCFTCQHLQRDLYTQLLNWCPKKDRQLGIRQLNGCKNWRRARRRYGPKKIEALIEELKPRAKTKKKPRTVKTRKKGLKKKLTKKGSKIIAKSVAKSGLAQAGVPLDVASMAINFADEVGGELFKLARDHVRGR